MPFIEMFEQFVRESDDSSWRKINGNRYDMLRLCIESGIPFEINDFSKLYHKYKGDFWMGSEPSGLYALAISSGNSLAVKAWETHFKIEPYLLMGKRLAPGIDFIWNGHMVRVTSITAERIIACGQQGTEDRRYRITHEDIVVRSKSIRGFIKERTATWYEMLVALREKESSEVAIIPHLEVRDYVRDFITETMQDNDMFKVSYAIDCGFSVHAFSKNFSTEDAIAAAVDCWFSGRDGVIARLAHDHTVELVQKRLVKASGGSHLNLAAA